ncbi:MAG TPA: T9SS type A sorting domain-containing protein [Flavisolibacter sp.]|jgi:hypothetical protein|nr:T9SS type A sorting domain-containing protein [Flavisolibacter sp.]
MDLRFTLSIFLFCISFNAFSQSETASNNISTPLPLVWDNIQVNKDSEGNNIITWWALPEYHVVEFIIQRSDNGHSFKAFKRIVANRRDNNYQVQINDKGNQYYRIISIDDRNKFSYSKIVTVKGTNSTGLIYDGRNTLHFQKEENVLTDIHLCNVNGNVFVFSKKQIQNGSLDISFLPRGMYFVSITGSNNQANRFIKL